MSIQQPGEEARVDYEDNWPWPGKPWPWCRWAEWTGGDGTYYPAIPHHAHMVNGGNTACPGVPGIIPNEIRDRSTT